VSRNCSRDSTSLALKHGGPTPCHQTKLAEVDCCACAYEVATEKFVWTERCRRAFCYGANIVQSHVDSTSYAHRLEKYATRYGFRVAMPGFQPRYVKQELLDASYLFVTDLDLMLRVCAVEGRAGECAVSWGGRRETITYTAKLSTKLVSDAQRLVLMGSARPLKMSRVCTPKPTPCHWCQTMSIDEDVLAETVVVSPTGSPGDFDVFAGPGLGQNTNKDFVCCDILDGGRRFCPNGNDNLAGYSCTPIVRALDVFDHCLKHHLVSNNSTKWLDGGAVGKLGRMMTTQNGQCSAEFCSKHVSAAILNGGPLCFVYDFVPASSPLPNLKYLLDAATIPTLKPGLAEAEFELVYALPRKLTFQAAAERSNMYQTDWWRDVY
jgi:hypothetical protein